MSTQKSQDQLALDNLEDEIRRVVKDSNGWLDTPNDQLGGRKPGDMLHSPDEDELRDLIRAIIQGMPT